MNHNRTTVPNRRSANGSRVTPARPRRIALSVLLGTMVAVPTAALAPGANAATAPASVSVSFDGATKKLSGFPKTLKGGLTTVTLTNSASYGVNLQLAQLTGKRSDADIEKAVNSEEAPPAWVVLHGGTAGGARAGVKRTTTVNLDKGDYFWIVFSDGDELGKASPWARFTVTGPKSATPPAGPKASIVTKEYGFEVSGLKAGKNTVVFTNAGKEWHHVIMQKLMPGKTLADFQKALAAPDGPPPAGLTDDKAMASLPVLGAGLTQVADFDLTKGTYVFICYMPDKSGKPHFMDGMVKDVKIS